MGDHHLDVPVSKDDLARIAGLPEELGIDQELEKEAQRLQVRTETRRYGKAVTIIDGFQTDVIDVGELATKLKRGLATGGTATDHRIELQGDHVSRVRRLLEDEGFLVE